jgi:hypothetical protein
MVGEGGLKKFNYGAINKQFNLLIKAILWANMILAKSLNKKNRIY